MALVSISARSITSSTREGTGDRETTESNVETVDRVEEGNEGGGGNLDVRFHSISDPARGTGSRDGVEGRGRGVGLERTIEGEATAQIRSSSFRLMRANEKGTFETNT